MIKKTTIFLICLILNSCSPWAKQEISLFFLAMSSCFSEAELGDGYYYLSYYDAIDVGYNEGSLIYKSTQKSYYQTILIQGGIVEVKKNKQFIIVGQNKQQVDRNFKTEVYYYWIIDKKNKPDVYGPFTLDDYLTKKRELEVPKNLRLKCEKNR